jgi:hypothetical protein
LRAYFLPPNPFGVTKSTAKVMRDSCGESIIFGTQIRNNMAFDRRKIIKSVFGGVILISTGCLDRMSAFNDANSTPEYQSNPPTQGDAQNETITANVEAK